MMIFAAAHAAAANIIFLWSAACTVAYHVPTAAADTKTVPPSCLEMILALWLHGPMIVPAQLWGMLDVAARVCL